MARRPSLGFVSAVEAPLLISLGPVGWTLLGLGIALPFLFKGSPRGEYQKFDRELFPSLHSISTRTGVDAMTGWFNELVGVDAQGERKVYGSWLGEGPSWGDKAAARVMELGQDNFLWSFQPNRAEGPWVLVGPHATLGSVVYDVFAAMQSAIDYFERTREKLLADFEAGRTPEPEPDPGVSYDPIDPGEVVAPPDATIDPPAPPSTTYPPRSWPARLPWWQSVLAGVLPAVLRNIPGFGGSTRPPGGYYPTNGNGGLFGAGNEWMLYGAAGLLLLAATKKKKKKHAGTTRA